MAAVADNNGINAEYVAHELGGAVRSGKGWKCHCPLAYRHTNGDKNLSFTVADGDVQPLVVRCFGGCEQNELMAELKRRGLWPTPGVTRRDDFGTYEAIYDYQDSEGHMRYQNVRLRKANGEKDFRQRQPAPPGYINPRSGKPSKWLWTLEGLERLPYRLPRIIRAASEGETIIINEGEKDSDNAYDHYEIVGTTSGGYKTVWYDRFTVSCRGANTYMIPDNDPQGREYADRVGASFERNQQVLKIVSLPGVPDKGDLTDWSEMTGWNKEWLLACMEEAIPWSSAQPLCTPEDKEALKNLNKKDKPITNKDDRAPPDSNVIELHSGQPIPEFDIARFTDTGNARRFVNVYKDEVRWTKKRGWLCYENDTWQVDEIGVVQQRAEVIAEFIKDEPHFGKEDKEKLIKFAAKSLNSGGIESMLKRVATQDGIGVSVFDFDKNPHELNCTNGILNVLTGEFRRHPTPDALCTMKANVKFDPNATCPRFDEFMDRIMKGDKGKIDFLIDYGGLSLTGDASHHCMLMLKGEGDNGKSIIMKLLFWMLGDKGDTSYAVSTRSEMWMKGTIHNQIDDLNCLFNKRMGWIDEPDETDRFNEKLFRKVVAGDVVSARFLYAEKFDFNPVIKLWMPTNFDVKLSNTYANKRRIFKVAFEVQIPKHEQVKDYDVVLRPEASGVLNRLCEGYRRVHKYGMVATPEIERDTNEYFDFNDPVSQLLSMQADIDTAFSTSIQSAFETYKSFCKNFGYQPKAVNRFVVGICRKGTLPNGQPFSIEKDPNDAGRLKGFRFRSDGDTEITKDDYYLNRQLSFNEDTSYE